MNAKVVRLNSELFPICEFEAALHQQQGYEFLAVEANTPAAIIEHTADCDVLYVISTSLPTATIESLSKCRVISRIGAGTDKIDVAKATEMGILVTNVPDFCVPEQADHTMMLMLALARNLPLMSRAFQREGRFMDLLEQYDCNQRLSSSVLGLIGFGQSAKEVAKRANAFGMKVIATRRRNAAQDPEADSLGVELVDLDTLLTQSDYISLHLPLTEATHHLLDGEAIGKMKKTAFLINTARGAIIDEKALIEALRERRIGGAGLDVFESINVFADTSQCPLQHPLLDLDNVILTPHSASYSQQSREDVSITAVANVAAVLAGRMPPEQNIVNAGVVPRNPLA
ncbi:MAG: C-terminal binding protein [Lentisphaeria bacterium]